MNENSTEILSPDLIKETNFQDDICNKEKKPIHRKLLKNIIVKKHGCSPLDIVFNDQHGLDIDDILEYNNKSYNFEYKTDYKTHFTGNMVFELIAYISEQDFPININRIKYSQGSQDFDTLIKLINRVLKKEIPNSKIARHLTEESTKYFFSYAVSNKKNFSETISEENICDHLILNGSDLSSFVRENYNRGDLIVTKTKNFKTKNAWYTVSWLVNINRVKNSLGSNNVAN